MALPVNGSTHLIPAYFSFRVSPRKRLSGFVNNVMTVSAAKTAEPVQMPFAAGADSREPRNRVLDGASDAPTGWGTLGDTYPTRRHPLDNGSERVQSSRPPDAANST